VSTAADLTDLGETQRQIAARLACSPMTVSRYLAIWRVSGRNKNRPPFAEVRAMAGVDHADSSARRATIPNRQGART
jgi:hypothetical protein